MILHQNNRFIYNNRIAVRIPNGLCIDFTHEVIRTDALELIAPDNSFRLVVDFVDTHKGAQTFTEEIYEEHDSIATVTPIHAVKASCGLSGYAIAYALTAELLEEYVFAIPGAPAALINVWFSRIKDEPYDEHLFEQAKQEVLNSIELI